MYIIVMEKKRFEFVDRTEAKSGEEAKAKYPWATTWGKAVGGWMVFESQADLEEWRRSG